MTKTKQRIDHSITVQDIMIGAAVGSLMVTMARMVRGSKLNAKLGPKCRADKSLVWRFLVGCDRTAPIVAGSSLVYAGHGCSYRATNVAVCAVCGALEAAERVMPGSSSDEYQDLLKEFQAARGVENYRYFRQPKTWPAWHQLMETPRATDGE